MSAEILWHKAFEGALIVSFKFEDRVMRSSVWRDEHGVMNTGRVAVHNANGKAARFLRPGPMCDRAVEAMLEGVVQLGLEVPENKAVAAMLAQARRRA